MLRPEAKRLFDCVVATGGLILLLPAFAGCALLIKCDSPGPVLYRPVRTGRGGEPFRICKFRTMVVDAEKLGGGTTALRDPRVTRAGAFLRHYKIDELPQLFNVVCGTMSLVGPRPELPQYTAQYIPEEQVILSVNPGITDYSSLRFISLDERVGAVDAEVVYERDILPEKNRLRIKYATEHTFFGDLGLIVRTIRAIVFSRSAQSSTTSIRLSGPVTSVNKSALQGERLREDDRTRKF